MGDVSESFTKKAADFASDNAALISYAPIPGDDIVSAAIVLVSEGYKASETALYEGNYKKATAEFVNAIALTGYEAVPYIEYADTVEWLGYKGPRKYLEDIVNSGMQSLLGEEANFIVQTDDEELRKKLEAQGIKYEDLPEDKKQALRETHEKHKKETKASVDTNAEVKNGTTQTDSKNDGIADGP